jgi:hypothetical protein
MIGLGELAAAKASGFVPPPFSAQSTSIAGSSASSFAAAGGPPCQDAAKAPMNTRAIQRGREAEVAVVAGVRQNVALQDSNA